MFCQILEVSNRNNNTDETAVRRGTAFSSLLLKFNLPLFLKCFLNFAWFEPHGSYINALKYTYSCNFDSILSNNLSYSLRKNF